MTTSVITNHILLILLTGLMGYICGLFSYLLDFCFWPGSVFKFYLPWLANTLVKLFKPDKYKEIMLLENGTIENLIAEAEDIFFYKMLGGCATCFNIWVAMISYAFICCFTALPWYFCFPYILVSSWNIRKLTGVVYK